MQSAEAEEDWGKQNVAVMRSAAGGGL